MHSFMVETKSITVTDTAMIDRFKLIQSTLRVNTRQMAGKADLSPDKLYQFLSGKQSLTTETMQKLKAAYPEISLDFLIAGQGRAILGDAIPKVTIITDGDVELITRKL